MANLPGIRIGTRKSALALTQTRMVRDQLMAAWPGLRIEIVEIVTSGDKFTDRTLADIGGKGLFTKEIEEALLDNRIDMAVHSVKDMETILPLGLMIACMLEREKPNDKLVGHGLKSLDDIPRNATFGTSSPRRAAMMLMRRPDLQIVPLRGNVETRLAKVENGEIGATLLAVAGLKRLNITAPGVVLPCLDFLPAVAQGAVGIECRESDTQVRELLKPLSHRDTELTVHCERAFLRALEGSCRTPIAGNAIIRGGFIHFRGMIIRPDGSASHTIAGRGKALEASDIGFELGRQLLAKAGKNFLK